MSTVCMKLNGVLLFPPLQMNVSVHGIEINKTPTFIYSSIFLFTIYFLIYLFLKTAIFPKLAKCIHEFLNLLAQGNTP